MEFKETYLLAMREMAPKMFRDLCRHGRMDQHLQMKAVEASAMLKGLLAQQTSQGPAERQQAEEIVRATLIDFPEEAPDQDRLEPPDDLPGQGGDGRKPGEYQTLMSKVRTSLSSRALSGAFDKALQDIFPDVAHPLQVRPAPEPASVEFASQVNRILFTGYFDALEGVPGIILNQMRGKDPMLERIRPFYDRGLIRRPEDIQALVNADFDPQRAGLDRRVPAAGPAIEGEYAAVPDRPQLPAPDAPSAESNPMDDVARRLAELFEETPGYAARTLDPEVRS